MLEVRNMVEALERGGELPPGMGERFSGYGVAGVPFRSGHVLAAPTLAGIFAGAKLYLPVAPGPRRTLGFHPGCTTTTGLPALFRKCHLPGFGEGNQHRLGRSR
jgi:hypothetical protein